MAYNKLIVYGKSVELYEYENEPHRLGRTHKKLSTGRKVPRVGIVGTDSVQSTEQKSVKRQDNARRSAVAFRRLVSANLGVGENPVFISLTYRDFTQDLTQGRADFTAFARRVQNKFGKSTRYIAVPEFQKSGRLHFHALFWQDGFGVLALSERRTRLFATLWSHGFVDLVATDGNLKIASYLSKYMAKAFVDPLLAHKKAYIASRNVLRPVIQKDVLIEPLFFGGLHVPVDLSTAFCLHEKNYMTQWLGKGRFRYYEL